MVETTGGDKHLHGVHDLPVHEEGGEKAQCGDVPCPVLPLGCSLTQFASFQNAWNQFSEQYKSWLREERQYVVNYQLNYMLLASIPEPVITERKTLQ